VGVVETRQHASAAEVDHTGARPAQRHHLGSADCSDSAGGDRKVALHDEAGAPQRANAASSQDQSSFHATLK
jgi:hypothetical protein